MSLLEILKSSQNDTRSRGTSLLCSLLTTSPLKVLNSFHEYYDVLLNFLDPSTLETINLLIVEQSIREFNHINEQSIPYLINYICYFLENPYYSEKIDIEQDINSTTDIFIQAIHSLFENRSKSFCFPERLRTLSITKNSSFLITIDDCSDDLLDSILKKRDFSLNYLVNCLIMDNEKISSFAAEITVKLIEKDSNILNDLSNYSSFLSSVKKPSSNPTLDKILSENRQMKMQQSNNQTEDSYKTTLQPIIVNGQKFAYIEPDQTAKLFQKVKPRKNIARTHSFLHQSQFQKPTLPQQRRFSTIKHDDADIPVCQVLQKQGKFKKWQDRWFEFYPTSSCLVWRSKSDDPKVKGAIIFDHTYSIQQVIEKNKFILAITPKTGKEYFLSFPSQDELNHWTILIGNAIQTISL